MILKQQAYPGLSRMWWPPIVWMLGLSFCMGNRHQAHAQSYRLATFTSDITIPIGHRCMGVLPTKSKTIADRLYAHGFVLLGAEKPIVLCALDWCEIRNGAYDQWRDSLAAAAGTTRQHVMVCSLHQHDAPVVDRGAADLLKEVGLAGELYDEAFHERTLRRVAESLKQSLRESKPVTQIGLGKSRVEKVASNRRVVYPDGRVAFHRGSRSGGDAFHRNQPEGLIDPYLRTISFWHDSHRILALHAYATHPMSYYGSGEVSSDFVGLARERLQREDFACKQIYVSGCSGDVTAGKFNDGSTQNRVVLADRIYRAMMQSLQNTKRHDFQQVKLRNAELRLDFHSKKNLSEPILRQQLSDNKISVEKRILAAMGLSSRRRVMSGQTIDFPCLDFGTAQIVLFPGEAFVGYQIMAQNLRPDSFVMSIGYGECWPGYIPTKSVVQDGFDDTWLWVGPGAEARIRTGLETILVGR